MSENVSVSSSSLWDQSLITLFITGSITVNLIVLESCMSPLLDLNEADTIMPTTERLFNAGFRFQYIVR